MEDNKEIAARKRMPCASFLAAIILYFISYKHFSTKIAALEKVLREEYKLRTGKEATKFCAL